MNWYHKYLLKSSQNEEMQEEFAFMENEPAEKKELQEQEEKKPEPVQREPVLIGWENETGTVEFSIDGNRYYYRASRHDFVKKITEIYQHSKWKAVFWAEDEARIAYKIDANGNYSEVDLEKARNRRRK